MRGLREELFGEINKKLIGGFITVVVGAIVLEAIAYYYTIKYGFNTSSIVLLSFILALVISFFAAMFIARPISEPVEQLSRATRKLKKGDFKTRVKIKTGDELEELGKSFNLMAEALGKIDEEHKQLDNAKTKLLSITSHELRSPMTPIKAQLQMLIENYFGDLNKKQKESLKIVLNNTNRLDKIIQDFLEISRIEAARLKFEFKKISIKEQIQKNVKEINDYLPEKNIKVDIEAEKLPQINADPERFSQVLRNLLINAKKFSDKNSKIKISAKEQKNFIQICVKDEGVGISKKNQPKIFQPFYQEEGTMYREFGGSGLGLSISKGIIEAQKGKIWVESEKGKGSKFCFTVPKKPVKEPAPIKSLFTEEKIEKNPTNKKKNKKH